MRFYSSLQQQNISRINKNNSMKTKTGLVFLFLLSVTMMNGQNNKKREYLRKVLSNLEQIKSTTYDECATAWEPGDTVPLFTRTHYIEEYDNPQDTTIGASYVEYDNILEKKVFLWGYDGNIDAYAYHEKKGVLIDDFSSNKHPFRPLTPPFFNYAKSMIRYALTTSDSIITDLKDIGDAYHFRMEIHENQQLEFFGKDYRLTNPYDPNPISIYELWISKENDLPYKKRREMSQGTSVEVCSNVEINKLSIENFSLYDYFPLDYEIRKRGEQGKKQSKPSLVGAQAPDWTLRDINEQDVSLAGFKSKVLLINFTGVGCGPCKMAIPFLNGLKNQFKKEELEVVAIESWKRKIHSIQNYINTNRISYKLLEGNDKVIQNYLDGNRGVPYYFILDENRVIKKIIYGYGKGTTDKEITDAIKELL